ncbi:hypothetical protein ACXX9E_28515 [Pseudomonas sp. GNP014]
MIAADDGQDLLTLEAGGEAVHVRTGIEGQPLTVSIISSSMVARLGQLLRAIDLALAGFDHPGLARTLPMGRPPRRALIRRLLP